MAKTAVRIERLSKVGISGQLAGWSPTVVVGGKEVNSRYESLNLTRPKMDREFRSEVYVFSKFF